MLAIWSHGIYNMVYGTYDGDVSWLYWGFQSIVHLPPRGDTMGLIQSKRRIALIVEDDAELRLLTKLVLEESELDIIECDSAEAALATMLLRGPDVAMIFADIRLSGVMDGIDLAREVKMRWPHLVMLLTSGNADERPERLPPGVDYMPKPWLPLNVLVAAQRAISSAGGR